MFKKMGVVTVGVAAGLMVAAPFASAHESHGDGEHHEGSESSSCSFTGGTAEATSDISGDSLANAVTQAPIAGNNLLNIGNCSDILNGNFQDAHINVGQSLLP